MAAEPRLAVAVLVLCCGSACRGANAPSCTDEFGRGETGVNAVDITCETRGSTLQCRAVGSTKGLYVYCSTLVDVTREAIWTVGDAAVARLIDAGAFVAVGVGNTTVGASWQRIEAPPRPIGVWAGTAPLPTQEIFGTVYRRGETPFAGAIEGAIVEIVGGMLGGRSVTSGVPPPLLPGYLGPFGGAGYYRLLGVPNGTYLIRVSKAGYVDQERTVTLPGPNSVDFPLDPR